MTKKTRLLVGIIMLFTAMMIGAFSAAAQDTPLPIDIGENVTGTLTNVTPTLRYILLVDQAQTLNVRVFAITPGLLPVVTVYDGNGNVVGVAQNNGSQTAVQAAGVQVTPGLIRVEVSSVNNFPGDVLVNVQGIEVAPPTPLPTGQIVNGTVNSASPIIRYSFTGAPDQGRWLFVQSLLQTGGPGVMLLDAATNETLASSSPRMKGLRVAIPVGNASFLVEISSSGLNPSEAFLICVALENNPNSCPVVGGAAVATQAPPVIVVTEIVVPTIAATLLPPLPPSNVCILGSATGQTVNVRFGPSTTFPVITQMNSSTIGTVIGRLQDASWYQINIGGLTGWISATVVRLGGPCQLVPIVIPTPTPTIGAPPTLTPTPTSTGLPLPTATFTLPPAVTATLNFSQPPNYGSTALTSGFVPDPFTVGITSGGSVNVNYLSGGCTGFATIAPDFSVNYTSGAFPTLRFYFTGSGDSTMIINGPGGSYFCSDDSFGTLNPTIDFTSPSSGRYDVWIGSFSSGTFISGTLSVTENTGNHP